MSTGERERGKVSSADVCHLETKVTAHGRGLELCGNFNFPPSTNHSGSLNTWGHHKHLWSEQMNLCTGRAVTGPALCSPNIWHFLTLLALWHPDFIALFQVCGAKCYLGIFSSISDSPQQWSRPCRRLCPLHGCRDLFHVLPESLREHIRISPIPMEWSQVTGLRQSWICCTGGCWWEKSGWAALLAAGKGMEDVFSLFGGMNSLI